VIDTPSVGNTTPQLLAKIRFALPRSQLRAVLGPAIGEVKATVAAQGIAAAAPWFTHYFRIDPLHADFEVCVPVTRRVAETGRVRADEWPATSVARTIYHGAYEGLAGGWSDLKLWVRANGYAAGEGRRECYAVGPESRTGSRHWRTELLLPLRG
jgi:effector-binding domain-containing protein